jgi:hypothetical protein
MPMFPADIVQTCKLQLLFTSIAGPCSAYSIVQLFFSTTMQLRTGPVYILASGISVIRKYLP